MKTQLKLAENYQPTPMGEIFIGQITQCGEGEAHCLIDHHFVAQKALSLMVKPEVGDTVNFIEMNGSYVIVQLLCREIEHQSITLLSDKKVQWILPGLSIKAMENLELVALNRISMMGKTLVNSAVSTLVQQTENLVQKVTHLSSTAKGVMRLSGKQQIITAEEDVRIDGERINIG